MRFALTLFVICFYSTIYAQNFLTSFGALNNDEALSVDMDTDGHSYTTGYFNDVIGFQNTAFATNGFTDVFVVKTSPTGEAQWAFSGGSAGPDRGLSIAVHTDGSAAVTGYYSNNAIFGSTMLPANELSQDLYVLKLNPDGTVAWAKGFGGNMSDTGFGVTFDNNGNVLVTGQFRGTINFDGIVFTSTPLPDNEGPSYDTFILKLDPDGVVLWAKQGKNSDESKGLDIKSDDSGNVYVCGQFSDTLTFDFTHPNQILNAAFVAKFDSNGNELWFKHFTSTLTNAFGLEVNNVGDVYVTGDNIGPLLFFSNGVAQPYPVEYTFNIFLAKFNSAGTLQWLKTNGSENQVSSRAIALDDEQQPYITGTFRCQFDEYALEYDTGIFYSAGFRDVFISKFSDLGERQWSRHMASVNDSFCSAIAVKDSNNPLICGSFEGLFVVANNNATFTTITGNLVGGFNPSFCGDLAYGSMRRVAALGGKDVFITAPINLSRLPIDYFMRQPGLCERPYRVPCVYNCLDTLIHCGPFGVQFDDYTITILKPLAEIEWFGINTGPQPDFTLPHTDTYVWNYTRLDGCKTFSDTLHAIIHPIPFPLLTDDQGYNLDQDPTASNPIDICFPDTALIWTENFSETDSVWWSTTIISEFIPTSADSAIYVNEPGIYFFNVENEFGCYNYNSVIVNLFYPIYNPDVYISFQNNPNPVDTIFTCLNTNILGDLLSSTGDPDALQFILDNAQVNWRIMPNTNASIVAGLDPSSFSIITNTSGNYTIICTIVGECDNLVTVLELEVYIEILPGAQFNLSLTGTNNICPTEYSIITATGSDNYTWSGPEFTQLTYNSIQANIPGTYSVFTSGFSEFGCYGCATQSFLLSHRPAPVISMMPESGIICPGDSVLLIAEEGITYQWLGPLGQLLGTTQTIYTDIPGFYSCLVTDADDCTMESNFVEVLVYSTPYLVTIPISDLCLTGSVDLAAVTHPSATVQWEAPISSNAPIVTVTEPGVYTGTVSLCGITTSQSLTIIETLVNAFITTSGPPVICNGDSLQLLGNIGMAGYEWSPGMETTNNIWITEPGEYTLYTYDFQGCQGTSLPLTVTAGPEIVLTEIENQILCPLDSIFLSVENELYQYVWQPNGETTAGIWITQPGTYQLTATDENGCSSASELIEILADTPPEIPPGETIYHCSGDQFTYLLDTDSEFYWLINDNPISVNPIVINSLTNDTTLYYYSISQNGCESLLDTLTVIVVSSNFIPEITGNSNVCAGDSVLLFTTEFPNTTYVWSVDSTTWSETTQLAFSTANMSSGSLNIDLTVSVAGCGANTQSIEIQIQANPEPPEILGNFNLCLGDTAVLSTGTTNNITTWSWLDEISQNQNIQVYSNTADSILILLIASLDGCSSEPTTQWLVFHPNPTIVQITTNSPVCAGNEMSLELVVDNQINTFITAPNGITAIGESIVLNPAEVNQTGFYLIEAETAYCSTADSIWLEVYPAPVVELGNDSIICDGGTIIYNLNGYDSVIWNQELISNSYQASQTQILRVDVYNELGCSAFDEVFLQFEICDGELSNIISPNGDGINDYFYFNPYGFDEVNFKIYNRWGKLICEITDKDFWEGTHCSSGNAVSDGTYFYVLDYVTKTNFPGTKKGYVQVVR